MREAMASLLGRERAAEEDLAPAGQPSLEQLAVPRVHEACRHLPQHLRARVCAPPLLRRRLRLSARLDRGGVHGAVLAQLGQRAFRREVAHRPEFVQVVLHRRARQDDAARVDCLSRG